MPACTSAAETTTPFAPVRGLVAVVDATIVGSKP